MQFKTNRARFCGFYLATDRCDIGLQRFSTNDNVQQTDHHPYVSKGNVCFFQKMLFGIE